MHKRLLKIFSVAFFTICSFTIYLTGADAEEIVNIIVILAGTSMHRLQKMK